MENIREYKIWIYIYIYIYLSIYLSIYDQLETFGTSRNGILSGELT